MHSRIRYTYQDYLTIPEDTSHRYEIVDGELFVTPTPRFRHQQVVMNFGTMLNNLAISHRLGEVVGAPITVHLHDEGVVEPDLVFVRRDRLGIVDPDGAIHGPPDLVVEVLSPSNRAYDRTLKRKQYMENGVAELWILDADERTAEVWTPDGTEPRTVSDRIVWSVSGHDFDIRLDEVFRS
jgi:Uma2 family endonuclease